MTEYLDPPCSLASDVARVTRLFCSLNSAYLMNCLPCIIYFTTKLVFTSLFCRYQGKLRHWPLFCDPFFPLLTMSYDSNSWPYPVTLPTDHESTETTIVLISQPHLLTTESPVAPSNQKMNDVSLWTCFPSNPSLWLSLLKPLPYSSHLRACLQFMPKARFFDLQIISE